MSRPTSDELKDIELANRMLDRATALASRRPDRTAKIRPRAWEILRKVVQANIYFQAPKLRAKPERVPKADKEFQKTCRKLLKGLDKEVRALFPYGAAASSYMRSWHRQSAIDFVEALTDLYRSHGWTYCPPGWFEDIAQETPERILQLA